MHDDLIFLLGLNVTASAAIGLFFFQFWRRSHDRLFLALAAAFWLLAAHWGAIAILGRGEGAIVIYVIRLIAFLIIIAGIIDKNRAATRPQRPDRATPPSA
jgi:hypothetical protein